MLKRDLGWLARIGLKALLLNIELSAPERDEKKWKPVFGRNQVDADCAGLSAIFRLQTFEIDHFGSTLPKLS